MEAGRTENLYAVIAHVQDDGPALPAMLDSLAAMSLPVIVVDSSGRSGVREVLSAWMCQRPDVIIHFVSAPERRALRAGFSQAMELGVTHAITLDWEESRNRGATTGGPARAISTEAAGSSLADFANPPPSHRKHPSDRDNAATHPCGLSALLKSAAENPLALILGCRDPSPRQGFLTRLSDLLLQLESGPRLRDPRCPLRIYPLRLIEMISPGSRRYPGEMEILARAAWVGCPVVEVSLPSPESSTSDHQLHSQNMRRTHFPLLTHLRLITRALSSWPHSKYSAATATATRPSFWQSIWQWCNPVRAWRELRQGGAAGRNEMAAGIALGVFIANLPAYGFQTVLALYAARRLHLHPVAVVAGSKASTPPVGPLLIAAAIFVGHLLLHGAKPRWKNIMPLDGQFLARAAPLLLDWVVGSLVVGVVTAIGAFIAASFLFRLIERGKRQDASGAAAVREAQTKPSSERVTEVPIPPV